MERLRIKTATMDWKLLPSIMYNLSLLPSMKLVFCKPGIGIYLKCQSCGFENQRGATNKTLSVILTDRLVHLSEKMQSIEMMDDRHHSIKWEFGQINKFYLFVQNICFGMSNHCIQSKLLVAVSFEYQ